jgi:anti-anti-sigma factor
MSVRQINFAVTISYEGDLATLKITANTMSTPELIELQLNEVVEHKPMRVRLDLSELDHLSSIGLGIILSLRRAVVNYGGVVSLGPAREIVMDVFRRTGVDVLFTMMGKP